MAGQSGISSFYPQFQQQALAQQQAQAQALAQQQSGFFNLPSVNYSFTPAGQSFQSGISGSAGMNTAGWGFNPVQQSGISPWSFNPQQQAIAHQQALAQQQLAQQTGQFGMFNQPLTSWAYNPAAVYDPTVNYVQPAMMVQPGQFNAANFNAIQSTSGIVQPRIELAETNSDVVVTCELPNINPNDLNLSVADDSLTISGSTSAGGTLTSIHRTVALPTSIKAEQVDASYSLSLIHISEPTRPY